MSIKDNRNYTDTQTVHKVAALPQLFLRMSLGLGFLLPVLDRFGLLGAEGVNGNAWGNWPNFVSYTHSLMPYMPVSLATVMAFLATIAETVFGIALIAGYQTKWIAIGSAVLCSIFGCSMLLFAGWRSPFSYSVFTASGASALLACTTGYRWSLDSLVARKKNAERI